jgi:hypothetical protein
VSPLPSLNPVKDAGPDAVQLKMVFETVEVSAMAVVSPEQTDTAEGVAKATGWGLTKTR